MAFTLRSACFPHIQCLEINRLSIIEQVFSINLVLQADWGCQCRSLSFANGFLSYLEGPIWLLAGGWIKMLSYSSIFQFQCLSYIIVISELIVKFNAQNSSPRMFLFSNTLPSLLTPLAPNTTPQCRDKHTCSWGTGTGELACRVLGLLSPAHPYTLSLLCLSV